jgi:methionyl-tRNA formyltransferase
MGSPEFAAPSLIKLIENNFSLSAVFTAPAKPSGRGQKIKTSAIYSLAERHNLPIYTPKTLKDASIQELIYNIDADLIIVVAYGFIIPKVILDCKKFGAINIHPSSLPKFRGAAPLQHTILAGDNKTSVCIMKMDEGIDTGPILMQEDLEFVSKITYKELHDLTAQIGADLLIKTLSVLDSITPAAQSTIGVSYAHKITKNDAKINWTDPAGVIERKIRAFNPNPGAFFEYNGEIFKIFDAIVTNIDSDEKPGTTITDNLLVVCGNQALQIEKIQRAGKNILAKEDFLRGYKLEKNTLLN